MIEGLIIGIAIANVIVSLIELLNHWERAQIVYFSYAPGAERVLYIAVTTLLCSIFGILMELSEIQNDGQY